MAEEKTIGVFGLFGLLLKLVFALFVFFFPLLSVWVASSLTAYAGGPTWLAIAVGALLCPIIPLVWDAWALARRRKKKVQKRPILTVFDRLLLRTMLVCSLFVAGLLFLNPATAFQALSARGDWMLDGRRDPTSETIRSYVFKAADGLEWLYDATHDNPYDIPVDDDDDGDDDDVIPAPPPAAPRDGGVAPSMDAGVAQTTADAGVAAPDAGIGQTPPPAPPPKPAVVQPLTWPMPNTPDPLASAVPDSVEQSYASVARYLRERHADESRRAKAIHDYVAMRIQYDHIALSEDRYPPQDAKTVFETRTGVCAGYAKLFKAMAKEAGLDAKYVVGRVRDEDADLAGMGHAWNAVRIDGAWYLVDATWNSPNSNDPEKSGQQRYRTSYFMTPPKVFGLDHFPDQEKWQLRANPISRGDFIRQPMMAVEFYRENLTMITPQRSHVDAHGALDIRLTNPAGRFLMAEYLDAKGDPMNRASRTKCAKPTYEGQEVQVRCDFPSSGSFRVMLFSGAEQYGRYGYIGQFEVTNRG